MFSGIALLLALSVCAFIALELACRIMGMQKYPLFDVDPALGYVPKPNQNRRFMNRSLHCFNELSMGTAERFQASPDDIALVGDSLVMGSTDMDQPNRLGPQLEGVIQRRVWPIGAGSWALGNELAYLQQHPEVYGCGTILILVNFGDLNDASVWASDVSHPRHPPVSVLLAALRKKLNPPHTLSPYPPTERQTELWTTGLDTLRDAYRGRLLFAFYRTTMELNGERADLFPPFAAALDARGIPHFEVRDDPRWNTSLYQDSAHPSDEGNKVLAEILRDHLL